MYIKRKTFALITGFHVLPMDICGARYMIASHTDTNVANDHTGILMTQGYDVEVNGGDFQALKYRLHKETGFTGISSLSKPAAIFSAHTAGDIITQMPPVETLGKTHYIPAIDLTILSATGLVIVTSTEDSTYVIIKGAYDQVRLYLVFFHICKDDIMDFLPSGKHVRAINTPINPTFI